MRARTKDAPESPVRAYERRLDADARWALAEGSRHFEGAGAVHEALREITRRLDALGVAYAVVGGMALFVHGYRRFTEDVGLLVTREGLARIHEALDGRGYVRPFEGAKNLRDAERGVKIEFLLTGQFPGSGAPSPIAFPSPEAVAVERDGLKVLGLEPLIELKLASGMTGADRAKDLADVQELIKALALSCELGARLNEYVREKYFALWDAAHPTRRYVAIVRGDHEKVARMLADAVTLERGTEDDAYLVTTDEARARAYEMHDEAEVFAPER